MSRVRRDLSPSGIDVDELAPVTPGLWRLAESRTDDILKAWGKRLAIFGSAELNEGPHGRTTSTFTIRELAMAAYVQGARDAVAVAVSMDDAQERDNDR